MLVAGFGGGPSYLAPIGLGCSCCGSTGSYGPPHPPFCVPLLTTQHPQWVEPKQVGSEGRLGTSLVDRVRLCEWYTVWTAVDSGQGRGCGTWLCVLWLCRAVTVWRACV